jgi:hypothetical protein
MLGHRTISKLKQRLPDNSAYKRRKIIVFLQTVDEDNYCLESWHILASIYIIVIHCHNSMKWLPWLTNNPSDFTTVLNTRENNFQLLVPSD